MKLVQQRQHEAQMVKVRVMGEPTCARLTHISHVPPSFPLFCRVKVQHMQEFVDKFRYNAKRASLVQVRLCGVG